MGYEIACLVSDIDDEFLCSICKLVLENPMQSSCEHTYCDDCIKKWLKVEVCPVESCSSELDDIKPAQRYFSKLLGKVEVKCKFEVKGCQTIVPMEQLQHHLSECAFSPNAEVICDKGCNIKITRAKYEASNCFRHLANRQDEQIMKFSDEVGRLQAELRKFTDEVGLQRQEITKLSDEAKVSANVIQSQQEKIKKLNDEVVRQREEFTVVVKATPEWQICENMKVPIGEPHILEYDGLSPAFAQLSSSLGPVNAFFKIKLLLVNSFTIIGLTPRGHSSHLIPGSDDKSIGYWNNGNVEFNNQSESDGKKWRNGDIVECGIEFPDNFVNDGETNVEVYFSLNGQLVATRDMVMPLKGFFPTIFMENMNNEVSKVEILN